MEIIRIAREMGLPVSAEASPHHLLLTHDACLGYDTNAKMNPPLRETSDLDTIREGVASGVITVLATDHAPHTADEKQLPFGEAPFGIIGLESAVAAYAEALVESGLIDWPGLIERLTINPARLCNLDRVHRGDDGLGELRVGGPADITVIDPDRRWTFDRGAIAGKGANSPFVGRSFRARPVLTVVGGRVAMDRLSSARP